MYEALLAAFETASGDEGVGALLLSGEGGAFTAGNDIGDFLASAQSAAKESASTPASRLIRTLARFEKPLVAAIEGQAVGIGTTLCFHCDLVYAAPSARFLMPFVNLGLVPEAGSSMLAPMRFGRARAAEFLLLAEPFDAETAREIGLVNAIVPAEELRAHALAKARALAAKPRAALLATRRLMRGEFGSALRAHGGGTRRVLARAALPGSESGFHGVSGKAEGVTGAAVDAVGDCRRPSNPRPARVNVAALAERGLCRAPRFASV